MPRFLGNCKLCATAVRFSVGSHPSMRLMAYYAAIATSNDRLPKTRSAAIRFSVVGCVERNLKSADPENGSTMYIWNFEREVSAFE